jgi:hypothetical protein
MIICTSAPLTTAATINASSADDGRPARRSNRSETGDALAASSAVGIAVTDTSDTRRRSSYRARTAPAG